MSIRLLKGLQGGLGGKKSFLSPYFCLKIIKRRFTMLESISWQSYFSYCILLLIAYYVVVGFMYYSYDLQIRLKQITGFKSENILMVGNQNEKVIQPDDFSTLLSNLKDELSALTLSIGNKCEKKALLSGLQKLLNKYALLKDSDFKNDINKTITAVCENNCSILLSEEEAGSLWNG
jgi:hypothetical protein